MTARAARPSSGSLLLAGTIRRSIATHRHAWGEVAVAALVALVPAALAQGALQSAAGGAPEASLRFYSLSLAAAAAGLLGYYLLNGIVAQLVVAQRRGDAHPGLLAIVRELPWGTLVVVDLVVSAGTAIGLELLVVPGVVFGTWFGLAPTLVETHHLAARPALSRSRELVGGDFWPVTAVLVIALFGTSAISLAIEEVAQGVVPGPQAVELAILALFAAVLVKPFAAVVTVELALELDAAKP